jgi:Cu-Zn family superoxide dismutase
MNRQIGIVVFAVTTAAAVGWACSDDTTTPGGGSSSSGGSPSSSGTIGTSGNTSSGTSGTSGGPASLRARAEIKATVDGGTVSGLATFEETGSVVKVNVTVSGAAPPGDHGIHIHANGNCDPIDGGPGLGAGGHWNPTDAGHGYPGSANHHVGDLGNITVNAAGAGELRDFIVPVNDGFYVHDGPLSVVGHAVVFHLYRDDGTQPVGDAGARPGCGVITKEE